MAKTLICSACGYVGKTNKAAKGSLGVEILLWLFFIVPGLIYSVWRQSSYHKACPVCGSTNLIPIETPNGRKMLEGQGKTLEQITTADRVATSKKTRTIALIIAGFFALVFVCFIAVTLAGGR